jgi:hypothetical protein
MGGLDRAPHCILRGSVELLDPGAVRAVFECASLPSGSQPIAASSGGASLHSPVDLARIQPGPTAFLRTRKKRSVPTFLLVP